MSITRRRILQAGAAGTSLCFAPYVHAQARTNARYATLNAGISVIFDGGIRRGSHVLKAMAIGAHCALIGRATLYGAAAGGRPGAARALEILREEIGTSMAMLGVNRISELDRGFLR